MFDASRLRRWHAWVIALAASLAAPPSGAVTPAAPVRNIVLVHGAFADGSSWLPVIERLQRKGYHVTAVQNPLTSLSDDVAATRRVLERQKGGVILVGHSWAGAVVTQAGNADNVQGLVYLSALVPDTGESVDDMLGRLAAPMDGLTPDKEEMLWLDNPMDYRQIMAGDVPVSKAQLLAATQQPISVHTFTDKVTTAAWRSKPSWYLVTEDDKALQPRVQRTLAQYIGATTIAVKSSHMSLISHPDTVASLIERAARSVAK